MKRMRFILYKFFFYTQPLNLFYNLTSSRKGVCLFIDNEASEKKKKKRQAISISNGKLHPNLFYISAKLFIFLFPFRLTSPDYRTWLILVQQKFLDVKYFLPCFFTSNKFLASSCYLFLPCQKNIWFSSFRRFLATETLALTVNAREELGGHLWKENFNSPSLLFCRQKAAKMGSRFASEKQFSIILIPRTDCLLQIPNYANFQFQTSSPPAFSIPVKIGQLNVMCFHFKLHRWWAFISVPQKMKTSHVRRNYLPSINSSWSEKNKNSPKLLGCGSVLGFCYVKIE